MFVKIVFFLSINTEPIKFTLIDFRPEARKSLTYAPISRLSSSCPEKWQVKINT